MKKGLFLLLLCYPLIKLSLGPFLSDTSLLSGGVQIPNLFSLIFFPFLAYFDLPCRLISFYF